MISIGRQRLKLRHHVFQVLFPILPISYYLLDIRSRHIINSIALVSHIGDRLRSHCKTDVFGSVDEFEDGGWCLVFFLGFDAEDARVAAWSVEIAFTERTEEFGEDFVGLLLQCISEVEVWMG